MRSRNVLKLLCLFAIRLLPGMKPSYFDIENSGNILNTTLPEEF